MTGNGKKFYTQNGYAGNKYDKNLSLKEIAKIVRKELKEKFPKCKFSVRTEYYSMGQSLHLSLMSGPFDAFVEEADTGRLPEIDADRVKRHLERCKETQHTQINQYYIDDDSVMSDRCKEVMKEAISIVNSYNYDDSDGMIDYFDTNFYLEPNVGKWNKGYVKKE